jgi:hypothetical protein
MFHAIETVKKPLETAFQVRGFRVISECNCGTRMEMRKDCWKVQGVKSDIKLGKKAVSGSKRSRTITHLVNPRMCCTDLTVCKTHSEMFYIKTVVSSSL